MRDPTFDHIAYNELRDLGYTCRHCRHWMKLSTGEEACAIDRPNFPTLCRSDKYFQPIEGIEPSGRRV